MGWSNEFNTQHFSRFQYYIYRLINCGKIFQQDDRLDCSWQQLILCCWWFITCLDWCVVKWKHPIAKSKRSGSKNGQFKIGLLLQPKSYLLSRTLNWSNELWIREIRNITKRSSLVWWLTSPEQCHGLFWTLLWHFILYCSQWNFYMLSPLRPIKRSL